MTATDDALARIEALERRVDDAMRQLKGVKREAARIRQELSAVRAEGFAEAVGIMRRRIEG